jgi:hypothetical protein
MVSQPNAASGDAPKNPRFYPITEIVHLLGQIPLKQKKKLFLNTAVILYLK